MEQVWKCDYCLKTDKSKEPISEHEKNCYLNPAVKDCGTCKRYIQMPYECDWTCELGWDFYDNHQTPCVKWALAEGK